MKIRDLISLYVETFTAFNQEFREFILTSQCSPAFLLQLIAFEGHAFKQSGEPFQIDDWETLSKEVMDELRMTLFTSYPQYIKGKMQPQPDGTYVMFSVSATATVQEGGFVQMPSYAEVKKHATNRRRIKLL